MTPIGGEALGNVANRCDGEGAVVSGHGGEADLHWNFVTMGMSRGEREPLAHGSGTGRSGVTVAMSHVLVPSRRRHESFDGLADEVGRGETGDATDGVVDIADGTIPVDDHHAVRASIECLAKNVVVEHEENVPDGGWDQGPFLGRRETWHTSVMAISVFLLDDHEVVRQGVRALLESTGDIEVVGEAGLAADALPRIKATRPQVAILDVRLPDGNGVEVCREVRSEWPDVYCLMLTSYSDDEALFEAIMAGASGYVLKQIRGNELIHAVTRVATGESLLDPAVTGRVLRRLREPSEEDERLARLTEQERKILDLIAEGFTNRQIGDRLHLAEKTVKNYVSNLLAKLDMERRTEAAVFAARLEISKSRRTDD